MTNKFENNDEKKILMPDNTEISLDEEKKTEREIERDKEDADYIPVIIKRTDEATRHPDDILEKAIKEGIEQHHRPMFSLFLSAIAAGLILGFTAMAVAFAYQIAPPDSSPLMKRLIMALFYPLGFIVCILSGTQLFTEQTATAVYPVLDRQASISSLLKLWGIVLMGNLTGTLIVSFMLAAAEPVVQSAPGLIAITHHFFEQSTGTVLVSSILAGWLMAQGGWLVHATPSASSQIISIYIVTFLIGIAGLHHSIAGSAELFGGLMASDNPHYFDGFIFLITAVIGNLIGGSFFVGVLNYGHIRQTQES